MHAQVSLTIEIEASASLTQMEEQIQGAGQQAMREALKQAVVLPHSVVDNSVFSPMGLTARETLLMLASQGSSPTSHFK